MSAAPAQAPKTPMSELFLVRHAQASFGTGDYDRLSELGHRQARWLGEYFRFRGLTFDRVICGEMRRHRETAAGIFEGLGQAADRLDTDACWNEFDFDRIVQAYLGQYPDDPPDPAAPAGDFARTLRRALEAWSEDRLKVTLPERWGEFEARVERGLRAMASSPGGERRILLVSSGGPIAMALRQVLQAPASAMVHMNLQLRNSSYSHVYFNARAVHLAGQFVGHFAGFNHVPHLDHPERAASVTHY